MASHGRGAPGELYDATGDRADGKAFVERSAADRHQFRFIVAADDGAELRERDLMADGS
jgi:type IV secretory pathway VirD2 relaxase